MRGRRYRAAALGLAALLASAAVGCGSGGSSGGGGDKTLTLAGPTLGQEGPKNPLNVIARAFEQANPGVHVKVATTAYDQFDQTVRVQLNGSAAPDVIFNAVGYGQATATLPLVRANALTDLSDQPWARSLSSDLRAAVGTDGKVYTLPSAYTVVGAIYDVDAFKRDGVAIPRTFQQVLDLCRREQGEGRTAFALGGQESYDFQQLGSVMVASTVFAANPDFDLQRLAGRVTFKDTPGWKQGLEQAKQMMDAGCFGDAPAAVSTDAANQRLATGKALMRIATPESIPAVQALNPRGHYGMFAVPGGSADQTRLPAGAVFGFSVPAKAGNQALAKQFVAFAAQSSVADELARGIGSMPAVTAGGGPPRLIPALAPMQPLVDAGKTVRFVDVLWPNPEVSKEFRSGIQGISTGQSSPDDVVAAMDSVWTAK
ncbi:MAG: ABC transporter substrate-binding protein [Conexibacter sp.]